MNDEVRLLNEFLTDVEATVTPATSFIERARLIAVQVHLHDTRWNGDEYFTHPQRVANAVNTPEEKIVAYLHDTWEDHPEVINPTVLKSFGFHEGIISALASVTRRKGESYLDFVLRSRANEIGLKVKAADIRDNLSDLPVKHKNRDKYLLALHVLEN